MVRSITLIFDDDTKLTLTGNADRVAEMSKKIFDEVKGFIIHETGYKPAKDYVAVDGGWDLEALKKLLKNT